MSVQRWKDMWYGEDHGELLPREDGEYVLYADHERALAEAVEAERERAHATFMRHYGHDTEKLSSAPAPVPSGGNDGRERQPRILPADDPEPGVGSVVLDREGDVWLRFQDGLWRMAGWDAECDFELVWAHSPLRLIHDGGQS